MPCRLAPLLGGLLLLLSSCSGGSAPDESLDNQASGAATTTSTLVSTGENSEGETTTTTSPPIILDVQQRLALLAGQCFAEAPPVPSTTTVPTTAVVVTDELGVPVTDAAGVPVTEAPATTLPESEPVAVVDCAGSQLGVVYANGCLGTAPADARVPVVEVPCPGIFEHPYPGSRQLVVAAAKFCLDRFEDAFDEPFALSELEAREWIPTEELWAIGDRRVACTATKGG